MEKKGRKEEKGEKKRGEKRRIKKEIGLSFAFSCNCS